MKLRMAPVKKTQQQNARQLMVNFVSVVRFSPGGTEALMPESATGFSYFFISNYNKSWIQ